ncbi:MAG: nucleotidyltransferase [Planctomycetota bacterium]|nr:MAG: nucleotidyltransferase [Planctomycetota bacterium]
MNPSIHIPKEKIAQYCRQHNIAKLAVFGSVLRDDFTADSDVDLLVVFEKGKEPGLISLAGMEIALSEIIGRKADLRTPEDLSIRFRNKVLTQAEVQYGS